MEIVKFFIYFLSFLFLLCLKVSVPFLHLYIVLLLVEQWREKTFLVFEVHMAIVYFRDFWFI